MRQSIGLLFLVACVGGVALYPPETSDDASRHAETVRIATVGTILPPVQTANAPEKSTPALAKGSTFDARLVADLRTELRRVGCLTGDVATAWDTRTRDALKDFMGRVGAPLASEEPHHIALTLLRGHTATACSGPAVRREPASIMADAITPLIEVPQLREPPASASRLPDTTAPNPASEARNEKPQPRPTRQASTPPTPPAATPRRTEERPRPVQQAPKPMPKPTQAASVATRPSAAKASAPKFDARRFFAQLEASGR